MTLASVMGDVVSIRARRLGALIHYRIVDEYEDEGSVYHCEPADSERPLSMLISHELPERGEPKIHTSLASSRLEATRAGSGLAVSRGRASAGRLAAPP